MASKETIQKLIKKQLCEQKLSAEEQAALDKWIAKSPRNLVTYEQCTSSEHQDKVLRRYYQQNITRSWEAIERQLPALPNYKVLRTPFMHRRLLAACTIALIACGVLLYWRTRIHPGAGIDYTLLRNASIVPSSGHTILCWEDGTLLDPDLPPVALEEKSGGGVFLSHSGELHVFPPTGRSRSGFVRLTTGSERSLVCVLPDGSRIALNAGSSIRFSRSPIGNKQGIELSGGAYFQLKPHLNDPISIRIVYPQGNFRSPVQIIGSSTELAIAAWPQDSSIQTFMLDGDASIGTPDGPYTPLATGSQYTYQTATGQIATCLLDSSVMATWTTDHFDFRRWTLNEALQTLGHWYGLKMQVAPSLRPIHIFARFKKTEALQDILWHFEKGAPLRTIRNGDICIIQPNS